MTEFKNRPWVVAEVGNGQVHIPQDQLAALEAIRKITFIGEEKAIEINNGDGSQANPSETGERN